jgi:predicted metalloprotease with PDZ domain
MRVSFALAAAILFASGGSTAGLPRDEAPGWSPRDVRYPGVIEVAVDATDVERGIFRVRQLIPVQAAGRITLLYPKWVPGNHAPTSQIERLAGLTFRGNGEVLTWARDPVDMHAFHVEVPRGVRQLEAEFQFLSATDPGQGRVVATPAILNLQWFHLALHPAGHYASQIIMQPSVRLPDGWSFSTQMPVAERRGATIRFRPVDLEVLIDSPLFAGRHYRSFDLGSLDGAPVTLDVVADEPRLLDADREAIATHRRLVEQAGRLFGPPPFRSYRFMLALTQELGGIGTEHLGSSENTRPPDYLTNYQWSALLAHELVHSWNGKARRPRGFWSADFNKPMLTELLWVYEGQTQFWGFVLAARSGLMTREQVLDVFARQAAIYSDRPGRKWRPLADTGNDFIITRYLVEEPWPSWRREGGDAYNEAALIWLETDGIIRELSGERKGLDDFARAFFTGGGERPSLYDFDDLVAGLTRVQPYDWRQFLNARIGRTEAPADWLSRSGYKLVFTDTPTEALAAHHARSGRLDLRHSLGLILSAGSGSVEEVIWDSPAFAAGLTPDATILEVNGAAYQPDLLQKAIQDNRSGGRPITLKVNNRKRERTLAIDYRGGLRFPRLERVPGIPDRLGRLLAPRS